MRPETLAVLAAVAPCALAYPKLSTPTVAGSKITVNWEDVGTPAISALQSYTLQLVVGGNDPSVAGSVVPLGAIGTAGAVFGKKNSASGQVTTTLAGPTPNGYYIQMVSVLTDGGQIQTYSPRFSIPGMTGTTPPAAVQAAAAAGTAGPKDQTNVAAAAPAPNNGAPGGAEFGIAYESQTGLTKWAPMQPIPPTKITANKATPLHPTSSVKTATTFLGPASVATTITESQTFSVKPRENTAAAASSPTDNMAKYLARWKD